MRNLCVSEESGIHGEEACRFEKVVKADNYAIVRAHDNSKYFCLADVPFGVSAPVAIVPELDPATGLLTDPAKKKY